MITPNKEGKNNFYLFRMEYEEMVGCIFFIVSFLIITFLTVAITKYFYTIPLINSNVLTYFNQSFVFLIYICFSILVIIILEGRTEDILMDGLESVI